MLPPEQARQFVSGETLENVGSLQGSSAGLADHTLRAARHMCR